MSLRRFGSPWPGGLILALLCETLHWQQYYSYKRLSAASRSHTSHTTERVNLVWISVEMAFTMALIMLAVCLHIVKVKETGFHQLSVTEMASLTNLRRRRMRIRTKRKYKYVNNKYRLLLLLLLLLGGDVERHPGPVTLEQFKGMNAAQRNRVSKPEMEALLIEMMREPQAGDATNNDVMAELRTIKEDLAEIKGLKTTVDGHGTKISELEREVKTLRETVTAQQRFWEEIEGEKRCKNLVFLGIKEEDDINDNTKVQQVLQKLEVAADIEIEGAKRLGRLREVEDDEEIVHKRPLLVTVKEKSMRNQVLKNARKLKDTEEGSWMRTVFIKADEHPEIRKEMKRLNDVAKLEQGKPENAGVEVKFDRKARKVTRNGDTIDSFRLISIFQ